MRGGAARKGAAGMMALRCGAARRVVLRSDELRGEAARGGVLRGVAMRRGAMRCEAGRRGALRCDALCGDGHSLKSSHSNFVTRKRPLVPPFSARNLPMPTTIPIALAWVSKISFVMMSSVIR